MRASFAWHVGEHGQGLDRRAASGNRGGYNGRCSGPSAAGLGDLSQFPCDGKDKPKEALLEGEKLHKAVPSDSWCVTLDDLKELHVLVARAVQEGLIKPTDGSFEVSDRAKGPNMYTVNEQFIKKVTRKMGGMSWALMKHRTGLKCDLFVTHCWEEGIFEFLDKVIHSWPKDVKHAYCCMLANPQNLDIASLLDKPMSSPFAKALLAARKMMVVSNTRNSIYTRLWCAYEAYTACREDKFIFTALPPVSRAKLLGSLGILLVVILDGAGAEAALCSMLSLMLSFVLQPMERYVCSFFGLNFVLKLAISDGGILPSAFSLWSLLGLCIFSAYPFIGLYFAMSILEASTNTHRKAAEEMRNGYRCSIWHATCSRRVGELAIRQEIEESNMGVQDEGQATPDADRTIREVDKTIRVLIDAGMSTKTLGQMPDKVNIHKALPNSLHACSIVLILDLYFSFFCSVMFETLASALVGMLLLAFIAVWMTRMEVDRRVLSAAYLRKVSIFATLLGISGVVWGLLADVLPLYRAGASFLPLGKLATAYLMSMDVTKIADRFGCNFLQFLLTPGSEMPAFAWRAARRCGGALLGLARWAVCRGGAVRQQRPRTVEIELREGLPLHSGSARASAASASDQVEDPAIEAAWDRLIASIKLEQ